MRRKVLVCGATGFIGRNIAEALAGKAEFEVYGTYHSSKAWDHPDIRFLEVDLRVPSDALRCTKGMDIVIQAAATTSGSKEIVSKPYHHVTDNAVINSLILRAAYENAVSHFIYFGCAIIFPASDAPLREEDFDASREMHANYFGAGWTKLYVEKMCEFYSRLGRTKHTVLRHTNVYGPHDKFDLERSHVFGASLTKVMEADEGTIVIWGTGEEERDLLYVSDIVGAVELTIDKQTSPFELFHIGYGESVAVKDLVEKIIACSGKPLSIEHDLSKPTIQMSVSLDSAKARRALGWSPKTTLEEGIKKTMAWYAEHRNDVEVLRR